MYFLYVICFLLGAGVTFFLVKRYLSKQSTALNRSFKSIVEENPDSGLEITGDVEGTIKGLREYISELKNSKSAASSSEIRSEVLQKSIDNLYIVNELGRRLTSSLELEESFQFFYSTINSMMDAAVVELYVAKNEVRSERRISNLDKPAKNIFSDWSFANNREVFLPDAENDYARYVFEPLILPDGRVAKSVLCFPLSYGNKLIGTICIISFKKDSFEEYHREIMQLLLGYISVAIENAARHEELNLTRIRAEQGEKFKEQFLANMSHEIRTPIHALTGITRIVLEKNPREDQVDYLERIANASESLLRIINDILDLSKIEAGMIDIEQIDFSIFDITANVRELLRFRAEEKGIELKTTVDDRIPPVLVGDPTRVTQVLINLVGNAIKFTQRGSVTVDIRRSENVQKDLVDLNFSVIDTGIGMTDEEKSRIFQTYVQAGTDTSRKYGGTGLGLSITKQLLQLLGGEITVHSIPSKGSTFSFSLSFPVSSSKVVSTQDKIVSEEMLKILTGKRILLADDNEDNRIVAKDILQLRVKDIIIDEATDGFSVLEKAKANRYDLILMDLVMPGVDGLEATKIIRKEFSSPMKEVPVIALTASVIKTEIDKCMSAGMNGFIPKPFKSYDFFAEIFNVLSGSRFEKNAHVSLSENQKQVKPGKYSDLNVLLDFSEGDSIRMKKYIDQFLTKIIPSAENLKQTFESGNMNDTRIIAHSMKSMLRVMGVNEGLELAERIEHGSVNGTSPEQLLGWINELAGICGEATKEVRNATL